MIRAGIAAFALLVLAACGGGPTTPRELDRLGRQYDAGHLGQTRDTCAMATHQDLLGKEQSAITLPQGARFICFGCLATQDHVPHRLNLQLGPDGKVASMRCG